MSTDTPASGAAPKRSARGSSGPRLVSHLLAAVLTLFPFAARANGRFPSAGCFIAGPGARNDVFALRTIFALLLSRDTALEP